MSQPGKGDSYRSVSQITDHIAQNGQMVIPVDKILLGSVGPISYGHGKRGEQSPSENSPAQAGSIVALVAYSVRFGIAAMDVGECSWPDRWLMGAGT